MQPQLTAGLQKVFMTADAVGGVWTYALGLARSLSARRISTHLAVLGPKPSISQLSEAARITGLHIAATGLPLDWTAASEHELDHAIAALKLDATSCGAEVVHLNAPGHVGQERWTLPLVVTAHSCVSTWWRAARSGQLPHDLAWRAHRTGLGLAIADAVIAPSRSFAAELASAYRRCRQIDVVYNARYRYPARVAQRRECVLTAGRLWDPGKNAAVIDAASALIDTPVYAAGSTRGPNGEVAVLQRLRQLGPLDEAALQDWYQRASVFVSMSKYEPFGLSVLEAAQAGCALVLSNVATFRELWNNAALFVPVNDKNALAAAIHWLSHDRRACADLARRASERAAHFSVEGQLEGTLATYRKALTSRARSSVVGVIA